MIIMIGIETQLGKGINNKYIVKDINGDKVIFDDATGLMWQQSGSPTLLGEYSKNYSSWLKKLNQKEFAGFKDWRLPTLEEAMSLIKPERKNAQYIDPVFDSKQEWIWTADKVKDKSHQWIVSFLDGICADDILYYDLKFGEFYVRAVRPVKSSQE